MDMFDLREAIQDDIITCIDCRVCLDCVLNRAVPLKCSKDKKKK